MPQSISTPIPLNKNWVSIGARAFTLFGCALRFHYYRSIPFEKIFGFTLKQGLYVEQEKNLYVMYHLKDELDHIHAVLKKMFVEKENFCVEILEKSTELNAICNAYLIQPDTHPFETSSEAIDFLTELTVYATIFPYYAYKVMPEMHTQNINIAQSIELLRQQSFLFPFIKNILMPLVLHEIEKNYHTITLDDAELILYSELLRGDTTKLTERIEARAENKLFVYHISENQESVETILITDTTWDIIKKLENISIDLNKKYFAGKSAYRGIVRGKVKRVLSWDGKGVIMNEGDILVAPSTNPNYMHLMKKAGAFITDEGGVMSHASIIARELKKPCIIGTKIATQVLKDGDLVEVDADTGIVRVL